MLELLPILLIGILGGLAVGVQGPVAGAMSQRVGGLASSFVIHLGGTLISGALLAARGGEQIHAWRSLSWVMLGSGVFGVVLFLTLSVTVPRLGATTAIALIVIGQLTTGLVIDQLGLFGLLPRPIDAVRVLGAALLAVGGYLVVR